jgi:CheY-like chemotaxis protein
VNGLQDFLTPFSHLIFANRDKVIVLLAGLLAWFTIQLLVTRWRNERLERDLRAAKTAAPSTQGRRYSASPAAAEEVPAEGGALPPVKGGRTYARNLGSALQKAGMSAPQIYSPPTPPGWAPQPGPSQPPPQPGPYAAPNLPWAAQPPAQSSPWGYPPAGPRTIPGPPPGQVPFYQPQPAPPQPPAPGQPMAAPAGPPTYGPPAPSFTQPTFTVPVSPSPVPPAQAPTPGQGPAFTPLSPGMAAPPPFGPPAVDASGAPEGGRRGKPKRRRFNFNVLENLEKMVQQKPAEPAPSTSWTPPAGSSAAPAAPPATAPAAPPALTPTWSPSPPAAGTAMPTKDQPAEKSLPLPFGRSATEPPDAEPVSAEPSSAEPSLFDTPEAPAAETAESQEETSEPEPATAEAAPTAAEAEPVTSPKSEARQSMRSMMFGEEVNDAATSEPAAETGAAQEEESTNVENGWPSQPWSRADESPTAEAEPEAAQAEPEPGVAAGSDVADAVSEPATSGRYGSYDPWKPAVESEPELEAVTPAGAEPASGSSAETPDVPTSGNGEKPGAGTIVIIEDDQVAASYYATLFKGNGYHVEVANDGVSGVDLCARMQPQVILLDVMMPRQNGILVLQTLRASDETKNTPVVVMSNFSEPTLIKRALQLGALEYVIKTQVEGPALLNALPRWMNREKAFAAA